MRGLFWCLVIASIAACGGERIVASPHLEPKVTHQARSLQPGEVVGVTVQSPVALADAEASIFGRIFPFYPERNSLVWHGLIGIDLETKAGQYVAKIVATRVDGTTLRLDHKLTIRNKSFATRFLKVKEKFVNPPPSVLARIRRESKRVSAIFAAVGPQRLWEGAFRLPVPGAPTSGFGKRSVLNGKPRSPHSGTDFRAVSGTAVRAPNNGRVVLADHLYYSGNTIIIDHGLGLYSYLAHLSSFSVREHDKVQAGEVIGYVGATGRVTGPHLHWTVRLIEARVDPESLIDVLSPGQVRRTTSRF
ncbi:MAG: M23 family metallopeptidase [Acidobacteriota bacterium]